ncbi:sensor histidine kinase [Tenacibaculum sp. ZS6-P6]|uniref:sensor histidine kinase n=1 Tax=Tenacibaculum sp. ZS6-P6 TaxID=3447503 RepID=UPI003F9C30A0
MSLNSSKIIPNIAIPIKFHLLFWLSYFSFNIIRWGSYFDDYWYSLKSNLVEFPLHIILVYINLLYFIPKFLAQKKYKTYIILLLISLNVHYIVRTGLNYFLVSKNIWPEATGHQEAFTFNHILAVTLGELYVLALVTTIKLIIDWINQRQRLEKLSKINLQTELNFLRMQIQPHFFFNTLNNLYALTLDKSDLAPEVVLKLSNIMQYVLYEVKEDKVKLSKEVEYIKDYVDLQKIRYEKESNFKINIKGDLDKIEIAPLIFLSFIENSFKHGKKSDNFYVHINIELKENNILFFSVENNYESSDSMKKIQGIGNKNVKRRLDLLYKDKYNLDIVKEENIFKVLLTISL